MMTQESFSTESYPSTEDGITRCTVCKVPIFYLESINIGSRGEVFQVVGFVEIKNNVIGYVMIKKIILF